MKRCKTAMVTTLLFLFCLLTSCSIMPSGTDVVPPAVPTASQGEPEAALSPAAAEPTTLTRMDYSSDAEMVVTEVEQVHPIFITGELPDHYSDVRGEYLTYTANPLTRPDFLLATQKYLTILSDGHMGGGLIQSGLYIEIEWASAESRLYLLDESGNLTGTEVTEIGGVSPEDVMRQVDIYYFAENDAARQRQYAAYCRQEEMLSLAGCRVDDNTITLTLQDSGAVRTAEYRLSPQDRISVYYGKQSNYVVKHRMIDDVFYIDLRSFQDSKMIDATVNAIRSAITSGTDKFIIDVRDNGGGNSIVGEKLLNAMGLSVPSYGAYIRISALSKSQRGASGDEPFVYYEPTTDSARKSSGISLSVLTNNITFSSATMLGVWVQDGRLGNVIGQPSSNSPTSYGDMLRIRLPVSGIDLPISHKKFLRPDSNADPTTLHPDIRVGANEDALETALEHLSQR